MHGRSYWNGFVKRLRQHPTETASRGKESLVAIRPCFGPLSHAVCKITLAPLIFGTLWALLLALDQVVSAIQPQVVVISVKQGLSCVRNSREGRTSVTSIHQFSGIFFSEAFFSGVASPCLKQSNNRVIYWVPTLSHVECDVIHTFAMTIASTATFHCILPTVWMCILSWTHWRGTEPLFLL